MSRVAARAARRRKRGGRSPAAVRGEPLLGRARALCGRGDLEGAAASLREAVRLEPGSTSIHCALGILLLQMGASEAAAVSLAQAVTLDARNAEAYNSLGVAFERMGSVEKAGVCYQAALAVRADLVEARNNLGNVLHAQGRHAEASRLYEQVLQEQPEFGPAWCNLGNARAALGRMGEAVEACRRGVALLPAVAQAHVCLGNVLKSKGLLEEAVGSYKEALRLNPGEVGALNNLGVTEALRGELPTAVACFERAIAVGGGGSEAYSNLLYLHAFHRDISPEAECALAAGWERVMLTEAERAEARRRADPASGVFAGAPRAGRKLRVGIVSAELGAHAVAEFLEPFLEQLDRERFEVMLFATVSWNSARTERLRRLADGFQSLVKVPDVEVAERIRAERIDILMDTTGHTSNCRLGIFAHRAAPVQCTYIGYWSTTGLTEMDWFVSDPDAGPTCDGHFKEGLWRLPRIAVCYRGEAELGESAWAPDPEGTVWLGSLNRYQKIGERTLVLWAKVMHALPEAKLLLEDRVLEEGPAQERIRRTLGEHGVRPERVEFHPYIARHEEHMRLYDRLDIALDTIPFNSGTTAFDALWMGVPLVALEGDWVGGRMASSVLKTLGRREWIAQDEEGYVGIVAGLARDVALRRELRQRQRQEMAASELCDAVGLGRALGEAFEGMYDRWAERATGGVSGRGEGG